MVQQEPVRPTLTSTDGSGNGAEPPSDDSDIPYEYLYPSDDMIKRNRSGRFASFVISEVVALTITTGFGRLVFNSILEWPQIGTVLGLGASAFVCSWVYTRSYFENDADQGAITVDPLKTLFGRFRNDSGLSKEERADQAKRYGRVAYGPGGHWTYLWEQRSEKYTVSLSEATENVTFLVQCLDGTLTGKGTFRLRADIRDLVGFQLAAGAIAANLTDLIKAEAVSYLGTCTVAEATSKLIGLNAHLIEKLGGARIAPTEFEQRFSVFVGDITIGELIGSEDVRRTLDAISEAANIPVIVAKSLGYKNMTSVRAAVRRGTLTAAQVAKAEERAMQISGQGDVQTTRHVYDVNFSGIDPETAKALANAAPAVARAIGGGKGSGANPKPKPKSK